MWAYPKAPAFINQPRKGKFCCAFEVTVHAYHAPSQSFALYAPRPKTAHRAAILHVRNGGLGDKVRITEVIVHSIEA